MQDLEVSPQKGNRFQNASKYWSDSMMKIAACSNKLLYCNFCNLQLAAVVFSERSAHGLQSRAAYYFQTHHSVISCNLPCLTKSCQRSHDWSKKKNIIRLMNFERMLSIVQQFWPFLTKWSLLDHKWMQNDILRHILKICFCFLSHFVWFWLQS